MTERDRAESLEATPGAACITIFRSRLRPEYAQEYGPMAEEIHDLATKAPGFISIKTFAAEDGERVSIVEFASLDASDAWRDNARHREAQRLGNERFFSTYRIQVCEPLRDRSFTSESAPASPVAR